MARADLLALSDDTLSALANRGIVKRALREVAEGKGPTVAEAPDGTVTGSFADGTEVVLAPGLTLFRARCSCPAPDVCRHRVMTVIAYRDRPAPAEWTPWSPADFTDDDVEALVGSRTLAAARKAFRAGYQARVRRPSAEDPVPTVELASCTVRFLVPRELGYARVDAARGAREDAVALAIWAYRAADEHHAGAAVADVAVGGGRAERPAAGGSGVEPVLGLLVDVLAEGVATTGPALTTAIVRARSTLDAQNLRWPVDALDDLAGQLEAYRARSARYRAEDAASLVAEVVARHRCVVGGGASLRPGVLGTEEAAETPLRLLRLTGLGARVSGDDAVRTVEVYLANGEAGVVLALRRRVEAAEGEEAPSAAALGRRKAGGARLSALAGGDVVTESAVRAASRVVRIAESRVGRTTVAPSSGAWGDLPAGILVDDLDAEAARLAGLAPAVVRPRVVAENVRAVVVEGVEGMQYLPGSQVLLATVRAPTGRATVSFGHSSARAGALDALAKALGGESGPVRFVAGHLSRHAGDVVIEPTAIVAGESVVVPAFAPATGSAIITGPGVAGDRLAAAVGDALAASAEVVHRGWRHLPAGWTARAHRAAQALQRSGLERAAAAMTDLAGATKSVAPDGALDRWADAHLRLLVTAEQL
ncbi:MAG TPA: hypothetical protein VM388_13510 [Acidimicrobiales bacterium]|nr:hypothetical protein [Acidimicrobiales bacterium]